MNRRLRSLRRSLAQLRPRAGRRLADELRAGRVHEIAQGFASGVRDAGLQSLLRRIDDDPPLHRVHRVRLFVDGSETFHAMLEAIAGARREVLLESYIFRDDEVGQAMLRAARRASERGLRVRVLADAFGSIETRASFWRQMREAGIELRLFHPLLESLWFQPYRDHRKILVVDRRVAFTGGMNIGEEYGSAHAPGGRFRDTHVRVEGPVASEMALVFAEGWERAMGEPIEGEPFVDRPSNGEPSAPEPVSAKPPPPQVGGSLALVLDSRPGRGYPESAAVLAALVGASRQRVWITNAYFAPRKVAIDVLGRAAGRGVDVRLLLQGPKTDVPLVRHAGHGTFASLLRRGVRVYEYGEAVLHAKSMVVDGFVGVVGSSNLDFRSFRFNAECNLVLLGDELGRALETAFEEDLRGSREIHLDTWRRRPWPHRLGDGLARSLSPLL